MVREPRPEESGCSLLAYTLAYYLPQIQKGDIL
jgi:hypothetical protein